MTPFEQAVASLGTTPEEVSIALQSKGIKGYRRMASCCPVAKYLNACGFPSVTVANHAQKYENGVDMADETISLSQGVKDWIGNFDAGAYPQFYLE